MILTCPSCRTRYIVPDSAVGMSGRKVRCAQCRFSWFQEGSEAPPPARAAPPPAAPQAAPRPQPQARPQVQAEPPTSAPQPPPVEQPYVEPPREAFHDWRGEPQAEEVEEQPRRRARRNPARLWTALAVLAALLMVGALAAIYFVGPQQISAWMGGDAEAGERLRFTRRDVSREPLPTDKELLTVTGEITNVSGETQRVPQIRAEVTDAEQRVIFFWMIAPPVTELQPNQSVTFSSVSTDVPKGGRNLNLSFGPTT